MYVEYDSIIGMVETKSLKKHTIMLFFIFLLSGLTIMCLLRLSSVMINVRDFSSRFAIANYERPLNAHKIGWLDHLANATYQFYHANNTGGPGIKVVSE